MADKYVARSMSDKTEDWPFWMVWDGSRNVTGQIAAKLVEGWPYGAISTNREACERLASEANAKDI